MPRKKLIYNSFYVLLLDSLIVVVALLQIYDSIKCITKKNYRKLAMRVLYILVVCIKSKSSPNLFIHYNMNIRIYGLMIDEKTMCLGKEKI